MNYTSDAKFDSGFVGQHQIDDDDQIVYDYFQNRQRHEELGSEQVAVQDQNGLTSQPIAGDSEVAMSE